MDTPNVVEIMSGGRAGVDSNLVGHPSLFAGPGSWGPVDAAFDQLWPAASLTEGWLAPAQARALYRAATLVPDRHWIVEIGSHRGRSTVFLASGKAEGVPLLAVDPFDNPRWGGGPASLEQFQTTLDRFELSSSVDLFRGLSHEAVLAWNGDQVGLILIDGAHDRESVLTDADDWEPLIAPGGIVFFHDAFSSIGVTEAVTMRHLWNRHFRYLGSTRTLVAFQRSELSTGATIASTIRVIGRMPYFLRNGLIKLALRRQLQGVPRLLRYRPGDDLY